MSPKLRPTLAIFLVAAGALVALSCALYWPFLHNPLVFDDEAFFGGEGFYRYATSPLGLGLRLPPYFTIAFTQTTWGHFPVWFDVSPHRVVSLVFHVACVLALFRLLHDLLSVAKTDGSAHGSMAQPSGACLAAFAGAAMFALHPVAVYGAGYLIQRSIVMATLFSLLSTILFVRGLKHARYTDAISAAVFYSLAVLSKEHSLLLPGVAALITTWVGANRRFAYRYVGLYLIACVPAALLVVLLSKGVIASAYEPQFEELAAQLESIFGLDSAQLTWWSSVTIQAELFFKYFALWLWPDTSAMAIDLRIDYLRDLTPLLMFGHVAAFLTAGAAGVLLLRRGGAATLAGWGLLYVWILFLAEFSALRFQEPFVLYRSYLWAPGIVLVVAAAMMVIPRKAVVALLSLILPFLFYQAHDRLTTMSNQVLLWEDAAAKLPAKPVPWGSRVLFCLGRAYVGDKQMQKAIDATDRCMAQYPETAQCYYGRAGIYSAMRNFDGAITYFEHALEIEPDKGMYYHHIGMALEELGQIEEAKRYYRFAADLGFKGGDYQLMRWNSIESGAIKLRKK